MEGRYNTRSPAVKRLMKEAQELAEPTDQYYAQPLEDNLFEWHFTVRGPADSDFDQGLYHGRILLPFDYPMKPPSIIWLTPNGRFETNKKICLSISGHHPESWQPSWSIRTALLAIIGFMPTRPGGAIGSLDYKPEERKALAKKSRDWKCSSCGDINDILLEKSPEKSETSKETEELAAQIQFEAEKPKGVCSVEASCAATIQSEQSTTASAVAGTTPSSLTSSEQQNQVLEQQRQTQFMTEYNTMLQQHWNLPPTGGGFPPVFPSHLPWLGMGMQQPQGLESNTPAAGSVLSMIPRFPLPPSQQSAGVFPSMPYPTGLSPYMLPPGMFIPPGYPGYPLTPGMTTASPTVVNAGPAESTPPAQGSIQASPSSNSSNVTSDSKQSEVPNPPASQLDQTLEDGVHKNETTKQNDPTMTQADSENEPVSNAEPTTYTQQDGETETVVKANCLESEGGKDTDVVAGDNGSDAHSDDHTEHSRPDLPTDDGAESNSESGIAPLDITETEQRSSYLERIGSSVPDLEKKSKMLPKGLRQRQSATATVPTSDNDTLEPGAEVGTQPIGGGQRIEAASGDTPPRLIRTGFQPPRAFTEARQAHRHAIARNILPPPTTAEQYDFGFFAMVGLSILTALILLNRLLFMVDWSTMLD